MRLIKLLILTVVMTLLFASAITTYAQYYDTDGKVFGKRSQETMEPKIIIDTVSITAGWGSIDLNDKFISGQHNVAPTSSLSIYGSVTPILVDSTKTVYYYGWWFDATQNRIGIKSNGGAADTGKVAIMMFIK